MRIKVCEDLVNEVYSQKFRLIHFWYKVSRERQKSFLFQFSKSDIGHYFGF